MKKIYTPITITILVVLLSLLVTPYVQAQDSLATVYFYRSGKFVGSFVGYEIKKGEVVIGHIKSNSVFSCTSQPGLQSFNATTEAESSIRIQLEAGQTYYIECGLAVGVALGRPTFRQVDAAEAKKDIAKIDPAMALQINGQSLSSFQADTVRALSNLFQRKRRNGVVRAIVFGAIGISTAVAIITYKQPTIEYNGQVIPLDSSNPPAADFVLLGASAVLMVSGISQHHHYSTEKLDELMNSLQKGKRIPLKIKSKLRKKDFR